MAQWKPQAVEPVKNNKIAVNYTLTFYDMGMCRSDISNFNSDIDGSWRYDLDYYSKEDTQFQPNP